MLRRVATLDQNQWPDSPEYAHREREFIVRKISLFIKAIFLLFFVLFIYNTLLFSKENKFDNNLSINGLSASLEIYWDNDQLHNVFEPAWPFEIIAQDSTSTTYRIVINNLSQRWYKVSVNWGGKGPSESKIPKSFQLCPGERGKIIGDVKFYKANYLSLVADGTANNSEIYFQIFFEFLFRLASGSNAPCTESQIMWEMTKIMGGNLLSALIEIGKGIFEGNLYDVYKGIKKIVEDPAFGPFLNILAKMLGIENLKGILEKYGNIITFAWHFGKMLEYIANFLIYPDAENIIFYAKDLNPIPLIISSPKQSKYNSNSYIPTGGTINDSKISITALVRDIKIISKVAFQVELRKLAECNGGFLGMPTHESKYFDNNTIGNLIINGFP